MNAINKGLDDGKTITESLVTLLARIGFYSFNRFMAKHGFSINYCLAIHRLANNKK